MPRASLLAVLTLAVIPAVGAACPPEGPAKRTTAVSGATEATRHFSTQDFTVSVPAKWRKETAGTVPFAMWRFTGTGIREMDVLYGKGEDTLEHTVRHGLGNLRSRLSGFEVSRIAITNVGNDRRRAKYWVRGTERASGVKVAEAIVTYQMADGDFFATVLKVPGTAPPTTRLDALLSDLRLT